MKTNMIVGEFTLAWPSRHFLVHTDGLSLSLFACGTPNPRSHRPTHYTQCSWLLSRNEEKSFHFVDLSIDRMRFYNSPELRPPMHAAVCMSSYPIHYYYYYTSQ